MFERAMVVAQLTARSLPHIRGPGFESTSSHWQILMDILTVCGKDENK